VPNQHAFAQRQGVDAMKKGKQLGEFSFKVTSFHVREDKKLDVTWEGNVTSFGFVICTMTCTIGDGASGHYDLHELAYPGNGTITHASAEKGEYKSIDKYKWSTTSTVKVSDVGTFVEEGVMELDARTWTGKFYEAV
jgi:hypothetical protein